MSTRNRNNLPTNLAQLQNLIKRDAESYQEEFAQQWRHFQSNLELFALDPSQPNESVADLTMFIAQVADRYEEASTEFPERVINLLATNYLAMNPELRMTICKALILLRNKNLASPMKVLELFFKLLNAPDKLLRSTLYTHIVNDIKNVNAKHKNNKINTTLQNYMFSMLNNSSGIAAKTSIDIMIQLYRKNVWNDNKTVNVIVTACCSKIMKVKVAALKFFLGSDAPEENEDDSGNDSDSDDDREKARKLLVANQVSKKSGKKAKKLEKALSLLRKSKKKHKPVSFNFSAIHLINDPQGFAEKLFKETERSNDRFEVKLMAMNLIGRLVGIHELVLLNFYPFLQRFLQPHQREVTKLLMIAAQSTHDMVPPDVIELVIKTIANNFVSEKNSNEVMAVGLNAIREICNRNANAMSEELLTDLVQYKTTKSKTVMMAARSLMQLYRNVDPTLLRKKDRGRPQEKDSTDLETNKAFGESKAVTFVPGADLLEPKKKINEDGEQEGDEEDEGEWETDEEDDDSDDDGWINVSHSDDEVQSDDEGVEDEEEGEKQEEEEVDLKKKAEEISTTKFFTDQDFKKIKMQSVSQKLNPKKKGRKRKSLDISEYIAEKSELVSLEKIENVCKKARHDKESRLATVYAGREGREQFGKPKDKRQNSHASTTNKEKLKNKPFMMVSKKYRSKTKKSFRDKQIALRDSLLKREKNSR